MGAQAVKRLSQELDEMETKALDSAGQNAGLTLRQWDIFKTTTLDKKSAADCVGIHPTEENPDGISLRTVYREITSIRGKLISFVQSHPSEGWLDTYIESLNILCKARPTVRNAGGGKIRSMLRDWREKHEARKKIQNNC